MQTPKWAWNKNVNMFFCKGAFHPNIQLSDFAFPGISE
jgi:hypothetical protein